MRRTATAALVGLLYLVAPTGLPGAPTAAHALANGCTSGSDWGTVRPDLASRVLLLVNQHRASLGLTQLKPSTPLTKAATWKSQNMAKYRYMAHNDPAPAPRRVGDRLAACGYPVAGWGENIASNYGTAAAVVQAWLDSPPHRENIDNPSYRSIGVAAAASSSGTLYWTQDFGTATDPVRTPLAG